MSDLRTIEKESIRAFVQSVADEGYLSGRVLDYGCGKQPYRDIVEAAGGEYVPWDRSDFPANVSGEDVGEPPNMRGGYTAILCTQVLQYLPAYAAKDYDQPGGFVPLEELEGFALLLAATHGVLVLTYPTNWPEVEPEDLHRFTKAGMERLLTEAGFMIVRHERRAAVHGIEGVGTWRATLGEFALGYGCICRA